MCDADDVEYALDDDADNDENNVDDKDNYDGDDVDFCCVALDSANPHVLKHSMHNDRVESCLTKPGNRICRGLTIATASDSQTARKPAASCLHPQLSGQSREMQ